MGYSEESFYGRRPRFADTSDLVGLINQGTAGSVDTINRTGEKLAAAYGAMPKLFGEGVLGATRSYRQGEKEAFQRQLAEEERKQRNETFEQSKALTGLQIKAAERANREGESEESFWNEPYLAPGAMGPEAPKGLGMNRRQTIREATLGEQLSDIDRKGKRFDLDTKLAEEQIRSARAQAAAAAANQASQKRLLDMQLETYRNQKALDALKQGISADSSPMKAPDLQAGQAGPPRAGQVDAVVASLRQQGLSDIEIQTLLGQAKSQAMAAAREQSMLERTVDPAGALLQDQVKALTEKVPSLANLANAVQQAQKTPWYADTTPEAAQNLQMLKTAVKGAALDPTTGEALSRDLSGDVSLTRGVTDWFSDRDTGGFLKTRADSATQAATTTLASYRAQAQDLLARAKARGDRNTIDQAQQALGAIDYYSELLGIGVNPGGHNTFVPQVPQQEAAPMFQPPQPPRPVQANGVPGAPRYDGRG